MNSKESTQTEPCKPHVVVLGGGFAGIATVRELLRTTNACITLVSNKTFFEYYPALYRVAGGSSPLDVCISYYELFDDPRLVVVEETVTSIDLEGKRVWGNDGIDFTYDYLVVGLGSEISFFGIPGLAEHAFRFKSIHEAIYFKTTIENDLCAVGSRTEENPFTIAIAGAGPSGVELAGEFIGFIKQRLNSRDYKKIKLMLLERGPRVLGTFPEKASRRALKQLQSLGVDVRTDCHVTALDEGVLSCESETIPVDRVVWTAGFKTNSLFTSTPGFVANERGRVHVGEYLQVPEHPNVFVVGDGADTQFSGLAQTALHQGEYIAGHIARLDRRATLKPYQPAPVTFVVPVGTWALLSHNNFVVSGWWVWVLRYLIDARFMFSILSFKRAFRHVFSKWL